MVLPQNPITATDRTIATLNLSKDAHKVNVSGVATIDCQGGSEYETHILTIVNTGIATVGSPSILPIPVRFRTIITYC